MSGGKIPELEDPGYRTLPQARVEASVYKYTTPSGSYRGEKQSDKTSRTQNMSSFKAFLFNLTRNPGAPCLAENEDSNLYLDK